MNPSEFNKLLSSLKEKTGGTKMKRLNITYAIKSFNISKFNHLFFRWFRKKYPHKKYEYRMDAYESALELNSLTLDTLDFLFGEMGGVEINDGFIMEV